MIEVIKEEAKIKEDAINTILSKTNLTKEDFFFKSEFVEGKLFKSSKYIVTGLKKEEVKKYIEEYIKNLSTLLNIEINCEILYINSAFNVTLVSDKNSILIGKEGKTLNAIQILLKQAINSATNFSIRVFLDVGNYKLNKIKNIEKEIRHLAKEIQKSHLEVSLDPMNSYERRIVHNIINEYENLETESFGEGKERHVVIRYVEK